MTAAKRILIFFMVFVMATAAFMPSFYIISNAEHNCEGEHCIICENIAVCESRLHNMIETVIALIITVSLIAVACLKESSADNEKLLNTPIKLKQKLLN